MEHINRLCERMEKFHEKYIIMIQVIFIILISGAVILYGKLSMGNSTAYKDSFVSAQKGNLTENLKSGDVITQEFSVLDDTIQGVAVTFATYNSVVTQGSIQVEILNQEGSVLSDSELSAADIVDNEYLNIPFESEKIKPGNEIYILKMTFQDIENQSIAYWLSENNAYENYALEINGIKQSADLVLREMSGGKDLFYLSYMFIMCMFLILVLAVYLMVYKFHFDLWKIYIPVGIFLGILYMIIIPVYAVPDEPSHAYTAYKISNEMLGVDNSEDGTIVMRKDDAESGFANSGIDRIYYNNYYVKITNFFVDNDELVPTSNKPVPTYSYLYYLSGFGITIGRILHFSPIITFLLGRLFNLVLFIIAVTYAIKKIPFGKSIVFLWALLPITLQQASSFSYDAVLFSLCAIIISLSVRLAYDRTEEIKKSEWIILLLCVMLLVPTKSYALLPVCVLPFIIYFKKYKEGKKILWYTLGIIGSMIFAILILKIISMLTMSGSSYGKTDNIIAWANEPGYSVGYLISHPNELFLIICNTIYIQGEFYFETFLGNSLGWFELNIPLITVLPYFVMLIIAGMRKRDEKVYMGKKMKVFFCGLAILGIGFACAGMLLSWTPISFNRIEGVQGRYFLPFAIMLFLAIRSEKIAVDRSIDNKLIFSGVWLEMLVFLFLYLRAM